LERDPTARVATARNRFERGLAIVSVVYAIAVAVFALHVIQRSLDERHTILRADEYRNLAERSEQPFVAWLFASHNGHLIPGTRLLLHLDYERFSGRGDLPLLVSFLSTGVSIALLYAILGISRPRDPILRRTLGAFLGFCLLWGGVYYGYLWSFAVHAMMTTTWLAASLAFLIAFAVRNERDPPSPRWVLPVLAAVAALGASLSCAAGASTWMALLAIALVARLSLGVTGAIVAGGCLSAAVLAAARLGHHSNVELLGTALGGPVQLLTFVLTFVGNPVGWAADGLFALNTSARGWVRVSAGAVGILGLVAHGARSVRAGRVADASGLLGLGLMSYGATAALLAGLGRSSAFDADATRFAPFAIVFWMGAAALLGSTMRGEARLARARVLSVVLLPAISIAMLPALDAYLEVQRRLRRETSNLSLMVLVGIRNEEMLSALSLGDADIVRSILPALERDNRGPFADPRRAVLGRPLSEAYRGAERGRCPATVSIWQEIASEGAPGAMIAGVAPERTNSALASILVADDEGRIRGLGGLSPARGGPETRWSAFLGPHASDQRYSVYAVLEDGSVCLMRRMKSRGRRPEGRS